jgi:hypothetical protein
LPSAVGPPTGLSYVWTMGDSINLSDPDFEPTDEQLIGLSKRAFAGVTAKHETALAKLRAEIELARVKVLKDLAAYQSAAGKAG